MCSPGCFSLLRGSAVLEDHVLAMYSTKSNEAGEYVQYDQGIYSIPNKKNFFL
jgi:chitin synthase